MRILVCGGRNYADKKTLYATLDAVAPMYEPDQYGNTMPKGVTIIHGGASGADQLADDWAVVNWTGIEIYKADWKTHGRAAGPIRNQRMIDEGKPDLVVAFPGGTGTANMIKLAKRAGIPVREVNGI